MTESLSQAGSLSTWAAGVIVAVTGCCPTVSSTARGLPGTRSLGLAVRGTASVTAGLHRAPGTGLAVIANRLRVIVILGHPSSAGAKPPRAWPGGRRPGRRWHSPRHQRHRDSLATSSYQLHTAACERDQGVRTRTPSR